MIIKSICIESVDIELLYKQRDYLLTLSTNDNIEGIINLLDNILDNSELHLF
jgi:hypothetical protein